MGIINVTPDSFSDGGAAARSGARPSMPACGWWRTAPTSSTSAASRRGPAPQPLTTPRSAAASAGHRGDSPARVDVPISIDTYKAAIGRRGARPRARRSSTTSAACGTSRRWPTVVAARGAAIVLMHTRGRSRDMYQQASYDDVVGEVLDELRESMAFATGAGIAQGAHARRSRASASRRRRRTASRRSRGSTSSASSAGRCSSGRRASRSSTRPLGDRVPASERDWATAAAVTAACSRGAHIVRVHAVARDGRRWSRVADEIRRYHRDRLDGTG